MLFNSLQFAVFFLIIYVLYLILNHKWQNRLLLAASYVFYGFWDYRFLSLILLSTVIDYFCGLKIYESKQAGRKKLFLFLSVFSNLSILGFFKYFNFFIGNLGAFLKYFGLSFDVHIFNIILPVGISFYTFKTISYTVDIYRWQLKPAYNFFDYALFVAFFPQLFAGPIERARNFLPQIFSERIINLHKFQEGCFLIFWGLFLKIFVADNLAKIADPVFASSANYSSADALAAVYAFTFQIFCDFDGYSNIAKGLGKCMGFDIMTNFNLPYFSTNPREFWQRWHISLSSWLRDYLYIPLGGNRKGAAATYRSLAITMLLGGLWHGASWNFIIWGLYHGILLITHRIFKNIRIFKGLVMERVSFFVRVIIFFNLVALGWLIFRSDNMTQMVQMLRCLAGNFYLPEPLIILKSLSVVIAFIGLLLLIQLLQFIKKDLLIILRWHWLIRGVVYFIMAFLMVTFGVDNAKEFIYFQF